MDFHLAILALSQRARALKAYVFNSYFFSEEYPTILYISSFPLFPELWKLLLIMTTFLYRNNSFENKPNYNIHFLVFFSWILHHCSSTDFSGVLEVPGLGPLSNSVSNLFLFVLCAMATLNFFSVLLPDFSDKGNEIQLHLDTWDKGQGFNMTPMLNPSLSLCL